MDLELEDHEAVSLREDDKTRRFVALTQGPTIDDMGSSSETTASPLRPPQVSPFAANQSGERVLDGTRPPRADAAGPSRSESSHEASMSNEPPKPPLPPIPGSTHATPETGARVEVSSPTIVVNSIVNVPTPSRMQREATVVVKRAVRTTKRSPLAMALVAALVIVASAIAFAGAKRAYDNQKRQELIEQRIEEVRRQHAE